MILREISTHKAVKENGVVNLYLKGLDKDAIVGGKPLFTEDDKLNTGWFEDTFLYSIPAHSEEDLFAIFEELEENNRIMLGEILC